MVCALHAHLVFTTRYRRGVFTGEILRRCEDIMIEVCDSFGAELPEFNGEEGHVHLLVHYPPKVALSTLVNSLKGVSARRLRQGVSGTYRQVSVGRAFLVAVVLRRLLRRRTPIDHQGVHRKPETTCLDLGRSDSSRA